MCWACGLSSDGSSLYSGPAVYESIKAVHPNQMIDAILWGGWRWVTEGSSVVVIKYYFDDVPFNWGSIERAAYREAAQSWSAVANVRFQETGIKSEANFVEVLYSATAGNLGYHYTPEHATNGQVTGGYNYQGYGWDWNSSNGGLQKGGLGYLTLVHELGHGLGLAHPHDTGGGSQRFPGVTANNDPGDNNLNQDVFTVMSYVHGLYSKSVTAGANTNNYGFIGGPMAFDIAAIQYLYGANMNTATGNNTYYLPGTNAAGTYWSCIWDAGGTDTIAYDGTGNAYIDLRAATLDNSPTGGGIPSYVTSPFIRGGFTIANDVVIEYARGGSGHDTLVGNNANNGL